MKICALVIPKEMKVEHSDGIKAMTDGQLDAALEALRDLLAQREAQAAKVIEGTAEPVALPTPEAHVIDTVVCLTLAKWETVSGQFGGYLTTPEPKQKHKTNRLMREADTAVGPRERKPSRR